MKSIPVPNSSNPNHIRYIVNLFYETAPTCVNDEEYHEIASQLSIAADKVLDDMCVVAAGKVGLIATEPKAVSGFVESLRELISSAFNCEGVSIFLVSELGDKLRHATNNKLIWQEGVDHYYKKGEGLTGHVWDSNQFLLTCEANREIEHGYQGKSAEIVESSRDECLLAPISNADRQVMGVVRCVNKRETTKRTAATMFSDDDAAVIEAILQAAAPRLELLTIHERRVEVLTHLTHDLRSPLVFIRNTCDAMEREATSSAARSGLRSVLAATRLLDAFLRNGEILADSRFTQVPKGITPIPLGEKVLTPAKDYCRFLLLEAGLLESRISIQDSTPKVFVDEGMFIQVVFNLLHNAIKYRKDNPTFKVAIRCSGNARDGLKVQVSDYGMGIQEGIEDKLFQESVRGEVAVSKSAGKGVGLYLCRRIVEAHGGTIRIRSAKSPTEFEIWLPSDRVQFLTL